MYDIKIIQVPLESWEHGLSDDVSGNYHLFELNVRFGLLYLCIFGNHDNLSLATTMVTMTTKLYHVLHFLMIYP